MLQVWNLSQRGWQNVPVALAIIICKPERSEWLHSIGAVLVLISLEKISCNLHRISLLMTIGRWWILCPVLLVYWQCSVTLASCACSSERGHERNKGESAQFGSRLPVQCESLQWLRSLQYAERSLIFPYSVTSIYRRLASNNGCDVCPASSKRKIGNTRSTEITKFHARTSDKICDFSHNWVAFPEIVVQ